YRNYNDDDNSYTHIDLVSVDQATTDIIDTGSKNQKESIFGRSISRTTAENTARSMGLSTTTMMDNTRKSNMLMKLGMVAMRLKEGTPKLKVGSVISYSVNS